MWYKIKQGRHRAYPLSLGIHTGKTSESYEVIFDDSCRYILDEENQFDINKLCGWSYGLHHQNSIRVGWRYVPKEEKIELILYLYSNGKRIDSDTLTGTMIELNKKYQIHLTLLGKDNFPALGIYDCYENIGYRTIYDLKDYYDKLLPSYTPTWGYNLGVYFGGNNVAPHNMKVWIKKL